MKADSTNSTKSPGTIRSTWRAIERFFFAPQDPTLLGLIRVLCGAVTLYTVIAYSFTIDELLGEHAWWGLEDRVEEVRERPYFVQPLYGTPNPPRKPETPAEEQYWNAYKEKWLRRPPPPYPTDAGQVKFADQYIFQFGFDFRTQRLPFPWTQEEKQKVALSATMTLIGSGSTTNFAQHGNITGTIAMVIVGETEPLKKENYLIEFTNAFGRPPSRYPKTAAEQEKIIAFMQKYNEEPHRVYTRGSPEWSVWFHLPPQWSVPVHAGICIVTFLFTIGFCTRVTAFLTWMGQMFYIHRAPHALFGVDAMMVIVLLYLMIGASGAALSVDRVIANWWRKKRNLPLLPAKPEPSVSAGFAIRLFQIHLCIIYCAAGLSKLQGRSWWGGTAVWGTLANWEFAPMQYDLYLNLLWTIGSVGWVYHLFMTTAGYFTLVFEIGYPALIWNRYTRWFILGMAVILHGLIGLFMGLKTFALMMLFMNLAFLKTKETHWLLGVFGIGTDKGEGKPATKTTGTSKKKVKPKATVAVESSVQNKRSKASGGR